MAQKKIQLTDEQKVLFDALTPLQQKFALGILQGLNQVDAYRKAGGKAKGESARTQASRMITFDNVKTFLDAMNQEAVSDAVMSRQEALERLPVLFISGAYPIRAVSLGFLSHLEPNVFLL